MITYLDSINVRKWQSFLIGHQNVGVPTYFLPLTLTTKSSHYLASKSILPVFYFEMTTQNTRFQLL